MTAQGPLAGRRVLVTGGHRRLGRAVALDLAAAGADVAVHHRHGGEEAVSVVEAIRALGCRAISVQAELTEPTRVAALLGHATDTTAVTHYARRSAGSRTLIASREVALPAPAEEAVALVRPGKVFRPTTNSVGQPDVECGGPTLSP